MAKYKLCFADATQRQEDEEKKNWNYIIQSRFSHRLSDINLESFVDEFGWIDFTASIPFEAVEIRPSGEDEEMPFNYEDFKKVKKCVQALLHDELRTIEVFSVADEQDKVVLTEEDL